MEALLSYNGKELRVPVVADSGATEYLILGQNDADFLGLGNPDSITSARVVGGATIELNAFECFVTVSIMLNDGSIARASMPPLVLVEPGSSEQPEAPATERILGNFVFVVRLKQFYGYVPF